MQKEKCIKEIQKFIQEYHEKLDLDAWAWYDLPDESDLHYLVMLDWQEGYDENENSKYIKNGVGLNVSIRVDVGQYFKYDNPYPICNDDGDVIDGVTLDESDLKDNFKSTAEYMYELFQQAKQCEDITKKYNGGVYQATYKCNQ